MEMDEHIEENSNVKEYMNENSDEEEFQTTDEHFKIFYDQCKYWIKKLGLLNYEIFIVHKLLNQNKADVDYDVKNKMAIIALSTIWYNIEPTKKRLSKSAFHEVMEILLGTIRNLLEKTNIDEYVIDSEIHSVIRTLENTFFIDNFINNNKEKKNVKQKK